jgi:hypothetical protein
VQGQRLPPPAAAGETYGEQVQERFDETALRRGVLAVSVLDDVDVLPQDAGVALPGTPAVLVTWAELDGTCGPHEPSSTAGRARIASLLRLRRRVADLGAGAGEALHDAAVALALPAGHALHPGPDWPTARIPGGALDLGVGLDPNFTGADGPVPLPPAVAAAAGADVHAWWPELAAHAETMGALSAARLVRDAGLRPRPGRSGPGSDLRGVGGCDVLTLLSSPSLRSALAGFDGSGLRAVAVPVRSRGWCDPSRVDPAYVAAVWELTSEPERGVATPLLVTRDEVTLPLPGGSVTRHAVEPRPPRDPS